MWVRLLLFFLIKSVLCGSNEDRNFEDRNAKDHGFLFSMPKTLVNGKNETVCLSLHATKLPSKAVIDLKWKDQHYPTLRTLKKDQECFPLHVPTLSIEEPQFVKIKVTIQINGQLISSRNQDPILLYPDKTTKTFIETDRYAYKPGDTVKFRLLSINSEFLPQSEVINEVKLKNPLDITVAVWENIKPEFGLTQLQYHIVQESLTGKWKIEANGEAVTFEVEKYVLPKFNVDILYPKIIYYEKEEVKIKVCAKYSYEKSVNGYGLIKIIDSYSNMEPLYKTDRLSEGCTEFTVTNKELNLPKIKALYTVYDPKIHIHITATVTEDGTNRIQMSMVKSVISLNPYNIKFITEPIFQPGMPYKGILQLTNVHVDTTSQIFEICYNFAINKSWNYLNNEQCSNFTTLGLQKFIEFGILPLQSKVIHIHLTARSLNYTNIGDSFLVVRQYSLSNRYFYLDNKSNESSGCKTTQEFTVAFRRDKFTTNETITFYYIVKSRQNLQKMGKHIHTVDKIYPSSDLKNVIGSNHKFVKNKYVYLDEFTLSFDMQTTVVTSYQLLVYYVTKSGETIAATKNIEIEPCLKNKVKAEWSQDRLYPGSAATMNLNVNSNSLCAISSIDKSSSFLQTPHTQLNKHLLIKPFLKERESAPTNRKICTTPIRKRARAVSYTENEETSFTVLNKRRRKRYIYPFSEDFDSYDIFNRFGTIVISNLKIITKPCYTGPLLRNDSQAQYMIQTSEYDDQNDEKNLPIRNFFPETWLWDLVRVHKDVNKKIERTLPHSITNWVTNVMCVSPTTGIGFSEVVELSAFQPFFVDVAIPYSVKKDESFYLHVNIFNYLNYSIPIRIKLEYSNKLEINPSSNKNLSYCVQQNGTMAHAFYLKALETGKANVTVLAEVDTDFPSKCGPDSVVNKRDIIQKKILIEPEGYPVRMTKSAILCGLGSKGSTNITWETAIPNDVVPGTDKAHLVFNGDLLGPTIENLENLLTIPTGCGEQIMASVAPNLYIMRYLEATNKLTTSLKQRIIRNLKIGYQRILNYAHKDGSFSAFGYHDPSGSMFLTAFVVRTLKEAKQYIYVDQKIIDKAVNWIFGHQLENGCFNAMLHVFQDMGGTSTENSTASLTAYVILSLEEAKIAIPSDVKTNAKYCIRSLDNPDKYSLAISCYALFKVTWISEATRMLKKLLTMSHQQQNFMWWSTKDSNESTATDIEITGYVLLALLHQNTTENLANAHSVARWLSSKQGPLGGFRTTQDTVVVLDALTKYAALINERKLNVKVQVNGINQNHKFTIKSQDNIKSKKIMLKEINNKILIDVAGEGCILAQVIFSYYIKHMRTSEAFKLDLDIAPVSNVDPCTITSLSPCFAYTGPDTQSNMAVLEVTLPSGYSADRASLYKLIDSESKSKVKMFEELQDQVVLYFTKLDDQQVCITFNINENTVVETRKDSVIKLYDYYKPEYESIQFYHMNKDCFLNNTHLPSLSEKPKIINLTNDYIEEISNKVNKPEKIENVTDDNSLPRSDLQDFIKKRQKRHIISNKKPSNLNPDFVDMDMDMATPNGVEGNRPVFVKAPKNMTISKSNTRIRKDLSMKFVTEENSEISNGLGGTVQVHIPQDIQINKPRAKRSINGNNKYIIQKHNLNPNFVDMDMNMATPNGVEGNRPVFVKAPKNMTINKSNTRIRKDLSMKFVADKNSDVSTGLEGNVQAYISQDIKIKNRRTKRSINGNNKYITQKPYLNPNFVDMDMDMATPNGMEGNFPTYIKPNSELLRNMTKHNN